MASKVLWIVGLLACASAWAQLPDAFLKANGRDLRNRAGQGDVVALRGVNLGGWLEWQAWMCPIDSSRTPAIRDLNEGHNGYNFDVRRLLTERFGGEEAERLIAVYEDSWIAEADLDNVKALGFNVVRLTLGYDALLRLDGSWRPDAFRRADWCVAEAWKRGIYTIIDYHQWLPPAADQNGSASGYWASEPQMAETVAIWRRIAEHYRGNPAVAMYDLLNEPNNSIAKQGQKAPTAAAVRALYDRLYKAIREVDPDHAIALEGMWGWDTLPDPRRAGYANVVYSFHYYYWWAKTTEDRRRAVDGDVAQFNERYRDWNVPCFVGEFNLFGDAESWKYAIAAMDKAGMSWTLWTLKNKASGTNSWGVYTTEPGKAPATPDLMADSAETIAAKWRAWSTASGAVRLNPLYVDVLNIKPTAARAAD